MQNFHKPKQNVKFQNPTTSSSVILVTVRFRRLYSGSARLYSGSSWLYSGSASLYSGSASLYIGSARLYSKNNAMEIVSYLSLLQCCTYFARTNCWLCHCFAISTVLIYSVRTNIRKFKPKIVIKTTDYVSSDRICKTNLLSVKVKST